MQNNENIQIILQSQFKTNSKNYTLYMDLKI
jgi:hypothetical protein